VSTHGDCTCSSVLSVVWCEAWGFAVVNFSLGRCIFNVCKVVKECPGGEVDGV
jgi:hypothetical protein